MMHISNNSSSGNKTAHHHWTMMSSWWRTAIIPATTILIVFSSSCFYFFLETKHLFVDVLDTLDTYDTARENNNSSNVNETSICLPKNIHLSPASSADGTTIDLYVSFTLSSRSNNNNNDHDCSDAKPTIRYGWSSLQKNHKKETERVCPRIDHPEDMQRIQFDTYQTRWKKHQSSIIFHGLLKDIPLVLSSAPSQVKDHWYQIDVDIAVVDDDADKKSKEENNVTHSYTTRSSTSAMSLPPSSLSSSSKIYYQLPPPVGSKSSTLVFVGDWGGKTTAVKVMEQILDHQTRKAPSTAVASNEPKTKGSTNFRNFEDLAFASTLRKDRRQLMVTTTQYGVDNRNQLETDDDDDDDGGESSSATISGVVVVGDLSYANGHLPSWEDWLHKMQPLFQSTALLVVPGNHELECDARSYRIFQAYQNYFRTPHYQQPSIRPIPFGPSRIDCVHRLFHPTQVAFAEYHGGNSYYMYRHGLATIIVLNSYVDTRPGSKQYQWFHQTLKGNNFNRNVTPWLIVVFHCPFHTTYIGHNNEGHPQVMMESLEPSFVHYGVNLVFSGHNHAYVRSHSIRQQVNNVTASETIVDKTGQSPVYVTIGTGGDSHSKGPIHPGPESWVASRDHSVFGAGKLYLKNATHARWERLLVLPDETQTIESVSNLEQLRDQTWIINHHTN